MTAPPCPQGKPTSAQGRVSGGVRAAGFRSGEDQPCSQFSFRGGQVLGATHLIFTTTLAGGVTAIPSTQMRKQAER